MRHISLKNLLKEIFATADGRTERQRLLRTQTKFAQMQPAARQRYVRMYGSRKWSGLKELMIAKLGDKCWYSEVEIIGADLTVDHYRPICNYWFLAFDAENYRVACPYSNSPHHNEEHGCAGGKGENFPLLGLAERATGRNKLRREQPVILDPCKRTDCDLLAFQVDGRPILSPNHAADPNAMRRVEDSKILLNLDHPDFNSKREQLYHDIADDVSIYEELAEGAVGRITIRERMKRRLLPKSEFSTAARYYLQLHRHLDWVEALLAGL